MKKIYINQYASLNEADSTSNEYKRLLSCFSDLDKQTLSVIQPLLQQLAYIHVTANNLQSKINTHGVTDTTKSGKKISANLQAYTKLIQEYNDTMLKLLDILPSKEKI